jgi:acyl-CoA synthetase (AMP-forming)/AMP-acid ligase II
LIDSAENAGMFVGARQIMAAPMFHLAGLSNSLMGLANGAELHLRAGFNPESILKDIEQVGAVYLTAVPAMFHAMVEAVRKRADVPDLSSMREMSYGASPIAPELLREVEDLFPGVRLRQFYGMTEVAGALTTLTPADHEPNSPHRQSAGRVNPGFEVRLVDRQGKDVVDGQPGEILAKGPSVLQNYWEDSEATNEAIVDGWFRTGDIAVRSEGYLTIMDRAKDMVVTGGENVYPAEVEAVLYEVPGVADVAVIGVPDEQFGERVHAVMVTQPDATVNLEMIMEFCRGRLAGYKLPRSMEVVAELPRNPTGKILKRQLRSRHWEGHTTQV